jgi:hypothetical protein
MATRQMPSPQEVPSTETQIQSQPVESFELISAEISSRAATTTALLQEILTRGDDRRYTRHWGINE